MIPAYTHMAYLPGSLFVVILWHSQPGRAKLLLFWKITPNLAVI